MTYLVNADWLARSWRMSLDELRAQLAKPDGHLMIDPDAVLIYPNDPRLIWPPRKRP